MRAFRCAFLVVESLLSDGLWRAKKNKVFIVILSVRRGSRQNRRPNAVPLERYPKSYCVFFKSCFCRSAAGGLPRTEFLRTQRRTYFFRSDFRKFRFSVIMRLGGKAIIIYPLFSSKKQKSRVRDELGSNV